MRFRVARVGVGCEQLGGYGWGVVSSDEVVQAMETAVEYGLTYFDTADVYGRGVSESRLGAVLRRHRDRMVVGTKFGVRFDNDGRVFYDASPQWMRSALHQSLSRLGVERLDIYWLHYWDGKTPWDEIWEALNRAVEEGKIGAFGISNPPEACLASELPDRCIAFQMEYSLLSPNRNALVRSELIRRGLTPVFYGCLAQGLLSGKYTQDTRFSGEDRRSDQKYAQFHGESWQRNRVVLESLHEIAGKTGRSIPELAIHWVLDSVPECVALVGVKTADQVRQAAAALEAPLPAPVHSVMDSLATFA